MAGSAAVGVRADGDDNVTAAGTKTPTANPPVQAGSTVLNTYGASDLVASESIQGSVGFNMYNEVNLMINEFAKKMANGGAAVAPRAAWERIAMIGRTMFEQS